MNGNEIQKETFAVGKIWKMHVTHNYLYSTLRVFKTHKPSISDASDLLLASMTKGLVLPTQRGWNKPRRLPGAKRRVRGAGWLCAGPRCADLSPHSGLGPAGEEAKHQAASFSDQIYCKPNYPEECHLWTWTCASDHPVKCTHKKRIKYPSSYLFIYVINYLYLNVITSCWRETAGQCLREWGEGFTWSSW